MGAFSMTGGAGNEVSFASWDEGAADKLTSSRGRSTGTVRKDRFLSCAEAIGSSEELRMSVGNTKLTIMATPNTLTVVLFRLNKVEDRCKNLSFLI
jgi:hypothetical protein